MCWKYHYIGWHMNNNIFNPQCVRVADHGPNKGSWDFYLNGHLQSNTHHQLSHSMKYYVGLSKVFTGRTEYIAGACCSFLFVLLRGGSLFPFSFYYRHFGKILTVQLILVCHRISEKKITSRSLTKMARHSASTPSGNRKRRREAPGATEDWSPGPSNPSGPFPENTKRAILTAAAMRCFICTEKHYHSAHIIEEADRSVRVLR